MAMPEDKRAARRAATLGSGRALVEDIEHLRKMATSEVLEVPELRRASGLLRRLLVDGDLVAVAAPRIGKVHISSPDLRSIHRANDEKPIGFVGVAGAQVFGIGLSAVMTSFDPLPEMPDYDPEARALLTVENFLKQRVICLRGEWATRHQIIKYVANVGSGVHSGDATEPTDKLIARMRAAASISLEGDEIGINYSIEALDGKDPPLRYGRGNLDCALIELMTTARLLTEAPDVIRLEAMIATET